MMNKHKSLRVWPVVVLSFLTVPTTSSAAAAPEGFTALAMRNEVVDIEGRSVTLRYTPSFKWRATGGKVVIDVRIDGDLGELQKALAGLLDGKKVDDECGDRVSVSRTRLGISGEVARLSGQIYYAKWGCVGPLKTRLVEQTADICIDLTPAIEDEGRRVALKAEVTCAKPSRDSILGKIGSVVGIEGLFRDLAQAQVDKARDKLTAVLPEELAPYDVRLTSVRFFDRGAGTLGLEAAGRAELTAADFQGLLPRLLKR
jgi:hypothetical protein